ncbi:hypothetical protein NL676_002969 [Syzygium grande]|nr:hypothetical protein NL676_002969 [Syzygium grande]
MNEQGKRSSSRSYVERLMDLQNVVPQREMNVRKARDETFATQRTLATTRGAGRRNKGSGRSSEVARPGSSPAGGVQAGR